MMEDQRFLNLTPHSKYRVKRSARLLENVADHAAADTAQFAFRQLQHISSLKQNLPASIVCRGGGQEPCNG